MRATAVIIKNGMILLIHRLRDGEEYFVLPGGGVEEGESIEEATTREVKEETSFDAKINKKLWEFPNEYNGKITMHHFYLVTDFSGELKLGGEEAEQNSPENHFELEWHKLDKIQNLPLYPKTIKEKLKELIV